MVTAAAIDSLIGRLASGSRLDADNFAALISWRPAPGEPDLIAEAARAVADRIHGRRVLARALVEIGNRCRNNCYYCGIRAASGDAIGRYRLTPDEIADACREAHRRGFRTFVLQGGEWPEADDEVTRAVATVSREMPDAAITLSLGERSEGQYERWRRAGASRYLLRHETALPAHYARLHPAAMSLSRRIGCLRALKRLGYQTGAGMMIGSPGQTLEALCADLMLISDLRPEMVGIGPFIPHHLTPFATHPAGSLETTLRMISLVRLILPDANIPATTALATLRSGGRLAGLLAGANVVMPNNTPVIHRAQYQLYDRKAVSGAESADGLNLLAREIATEGFTLDFSRGDFTPSA